MANKGIARLNFTCWYRDLLGNPRINFNPALGINTTFHRCFFITTDRLTPIT